MAQRRARYERFGIPYAVWLLLGLHVLARIVLLVACRHLPTLDAPGRQLLVGLVTDLEITALALGMMAAATSVAPLVGTLVGSVVAPLLCLSLIGNAGKVVALRANASLADVVLWREAWYARDAIAGYLVSPALVAITFVGVSLLVVGGALLVRAQLRFNDALRVLSRPGRLVLAGILLGLGVGLHVAATHERRHPHQPVETHPVAYVFDQFLEQYVTQPSRPDRGLDWIRERLTASGYVVEPDPAWPFAHRAEAVVAAAGQPVAPLPDQTNVLLITLESGGRGTMLERPESAPFLSGLRDRSIWLDHHYTTVYRTCGAQFGILCGMVDAFRYHVSARYPDLPLHCLPSVFRGRGYSTLAVMGGPGHFDHNRDWLQTQGIQRVVAGEDFAPEVERFSFGVHDAPMMDRLLNEIEATREPFFAYALTLSNHHPHRVPESWARRHPELMSAGWDDRELAFRYMDDQLAEFFARARLRPWFGRTLVVLVGDHAQWSWHADDPGLDTDAGLRRLTYQTVATFVHPALTPRIIDHDTSHIDIAPTMLGLLGWGDAVVDAQGQDAMSSGYRADALVSQSYVIGAAWDLHDRRGVIRRDFLHGGCTVLASGRSDGPRSCTADERQAVESHEDGYFRTVDWALRQRAAAGHR